MPHDDKPADIDPVAKDIIRRKARHLMRRGGFSRSDLPDLEQELSLHLLRRIQTFDAHQSDWEVFVGAVVTAWGANLLRNRYAAKRDYRRTRHLSTATESAEGQDTSGVMNREAAQDARLGRQRLCDQEQRALELDVQEAVQRLPEDLRSVAEGLQRLSKAELAREMGVPGTTLYESIKRIRWRFEKMGLGKKL
ncbi:MAG TPA: hypothetical protein VH643_26470 [Gemmataceae bacterium]